MKISTLQSTLDSVALVKRFYFYPEIDSTMAQARRLLTGSPATEVHGTLLLADYQTEGKGRHGRTWLSPPGKSILATIIFSRSELPLPESENQLSLLASAIPVAICHGLAKFTPSVKIKYPNDIVAGGRKLAGSLIETCNDSVLVGFGINCLHELEELPDEVRMPATSLFLETGKNFSREVILKSILDHLTDILDPTAFADSADQMNNLCETLGREICLDIGHEVVTGTAEHISRGGSLHVQTPHGVRIIQSTQVLRTWPSDHEREHM